MDPATYGAERMLQARPGGRPRINHRADLNVPKRMQLTGNSVTPVSWQSRRVPRGVCLSGLVDTSEFVVKRPAHSIHVSVSRGRRAFNGVVPFVIGRESRSRALEPASECRLRGWCHTTPRIVVPTHTNQRPTDAAMARTCTLLREPRYRRCAHARRMRLACCTAG